MAIGNLFSFVQSTGSDSALSPVILLNVYNCVRLIHLNKFMFIFSFRLFLYFNSWIEFWVFLYSRTKIYLNGSSFEEINKTNCELVSLAFMELGSKVDVHSYS